MNDNMPSYAALEKALEKYQETQKTISSVLLLEDISFKRIRKIHHSLEFGISQLLEELEEVEDRYSMYLEDLKYSQRDKERD